MGTIDNKPYSVSQKGTASAKLMQKAMRANFHRGGDTKI
jgi:hypothetical protein